MDELTVIAPDKKEESQVRQAFEEARIIGESQNFTRELVNEPGNRMTPTMLAQRARKMVEQIAGNTPGLKVETFGADKLVVNYNPRGGGESEDAAALSTELLKQFLADAPIADQAKRDLQRLIQEPKDYLPGLTSDEKKARLARISYANFLKDIAGVHEDIVKLYQTLPHGLFGVGIDAVSAQDAWGLDLPGFDGMKLDPAPGKGMNRDAIPNEEAEKYFFHFPDGNATIARLLVRKLIPDAVPGNSLSDVFLAKANYSKLDESNSPVRIRLNSTAVRVKHLGDSATAKEVEVSYARGGKVYTARAKHSIAAKDCPAGKL